MRKRSDDRVPEVDILRGRDSFEDGEGGAGIFEVRVFVDQLAGEEVGGAFEA